MLFLAAELRLEQVAGAVVAFGHGQCDAPVVALDRRTFELGVQLELLEDCFTNRDGPEPLHVGHALEIQQSHDHRVGVLHLVDRLVPELLGEPVIAPVVAHASVDEVLVDRRQLGRQYFVQDLDDRWRTLHRWLLAHSQRTSASLALSRRATILQEASWSTRRSSIASRSEVMRSWHP